MTRPIPSRPSRVRPASPTSDLRLRSGWSTHRGRRPLNEDAVLVDGPLLAVADGVGGAPRGDLASVEAIGAVHDVVDEPGLEPTVAAIAAELNDALMMADNAVKELAERWTQLRGAATTMCAALLFRGPGNHLRAVVANVGDSRCYHVTSSSISQVTTDHTLAEQLRLAGVDGVAEQAENIVVSVLGGEPGASPRIDLHLLDLWPGDALLLCTDGVSGVLGAETLLELSRRHPDDPDRLATALVRAAWDGGSSDNLTAAVAVVQAP